MGLSRNALVAVVVLAAVTAQVAVFSLFSVNGVVPDLALIDDHGLPVGQIVEVIGIGVLWDVVMAPLLLPLLLVVLERTRAPELAY